MARNRVIGRQGNIPWRIAGEQNIFKRLTLGKALILGRKTYESIGRPLPGRTTIVVTHRPGYVVPGVYVTQSIEDSLRLAAELDQDAIIGGGAELYNQTICLANLIYLTTVQADFDGDAFFPDVPFDEFALVSEERIDASIPYTFSVLRRSKPNLVMQPTRTTRG
jgi:dihydrofolate reductase